MASSLPSYSTAQLSSSVAFGLGIQAALITLFVLAGSNVSHVQEAEAPANKPIPIAVKPVMDDLPLLKLGGKRVRTKLPDMWKKQAPVKRFEESSAPSPLASKTPEALPTSKLAELDAEAPPPDAEVAKEVDETLDASADAEAPNLDQEGAADGVKEGTETDPLKARAVSQYKMKILAWFNVRFRPPLGELDCKTLSTLSASVSATVDGSRRVSGFSITRSSGNPIFDAKVQSTMQAIIGQELPPPPPLYPDILDTSVFPTFSGKSSECASQP
ncbi:MAG: TonB C-terminal domain-containing protein [Polyangiaceae bacterium]|nr:TonB C-terminal domain-containing protein [Polyangiaceae bacterium]